MGILEKLKTIANSDSGDENFKKMIDTDSSEEIPDELPSLPKLRSKNIDKSVNNKSKILKSSSVSTSLEAIKNAAELDNNSKSNESTQFDDMLELDDFVSKKEIKSRDEKVNIQSRAEEVAIKDSNVEDLNIENSNIEEEVSDDKSLYFRALAAKINDDENHEVLVEELTSKPQDFMTRIASSWKQDKHDEFSRKLKGDMNSVLNPLQNLEKQWRALNIERDEVNTKINTIESTIKEKTSELKKLLKKKVDHNKTTSSFVKKTSAKKSRKSSKKSNTKNK